MTRKRSFAPVADANVRILILGSLPGERSLAQNQYYGHPQNRFWHLMSDIIGIDLPTLEYDLRLRLLLKNGIGLWDVISEAQRDGSLDSNIRDQTNNDLVGLIDTLPHLTTIGFNGATAARIGMKALQESAHRYRIVKLPSSSPAYTKPYSEKLIAWQALKNFSQV